MFFDTKNDLPSNIVFFLIYKPEIAVLQDCMDEEYMTMSYLLIDISVVLKLIYDFI